MIFTMLKTLPATYIKINMPGVFCVEKACNGTDHGLSSALMLLLSFKGSCSGVSQNESEEGSGNWEKEKLRKNEVEETHNSGSQKDPKERSKVGKNGGESE